MDDKEFVLNFIKAQRLAVIATADGKGNPEAAVVAFGQNDGFELVFGTSNTTRKYQNLQVNQHVAVVIGWADNQTVQYEGEAWELSGDEEIKFRELLYAKSPASRARENQPDERHFLIKPLWLRYSDITNDPPNTIELSFGD